MPIVTMPAQRLCFCDVDENGLLRIGGQ